MKPEAKKIERPKYQDYWDSPVGSVTTAKNAYKVGQANEDAYVLALQKYCTQLEQERNEYKLKEEIAYTAKEIAQEAHQKVVKEWDGLKERLRKGNSNIGYELKALKKEVRKFIKIYSQPGNDAWYDQLIKLKALIK